MFTIAAHAQAAPGDRGGCPRPAAGAVVMQPADFYSANGVLDVTLDYRTSTDANGRTLFCFTAPDGIQSPTLHVHPGDTLQITLNNQVPPPAPGAMAMADMIMPGAPRRKYAHPPMVMGPTPGSRVCGAQTMDASSVNIHFHGTNSMPACHADEVIFTTVNSGQTFKYQVKFPLDEPPGLYWYHPHIHGQSEGAVQGGASGAIVVEGLENVQSAVAGLPARLLVIRDQIVAGNAMPGGAVPAWDISLNYVPISYPAEIPAVIQVLPGRKELWRVLNASADTVTDLQLIYDAVPQPLDVVGLDGVPTGSQDGTKRGTIVSGNHLLIPPAGRAEFIVTTPSAYVRKAAFVTQAIDTGPFGDNDTARTLAVLRTNNVAYQQPLPLLPVVPAVSAPPPPQRFAKLDSTMVSARRKLHFFEVLQDPTDPASPTNFFITVDGAPETLFNAANPPAIVTTQGAVEEWTIENRTQEVHEFHIHQIHFKLEKTNGISLPAYQQQYLDTVQVPYGTGSPPYPTVTVLMDFRGEITGDFVYHCHILGHEDNGMMATIRVLPSKGTNQPG
jgi:FtsP/CotA-like multicopper oxidase with cupredoxin domain